MTEPPGFFGIGHLDLSVSDVEASAAWYAQVLGFARLRRVAFADRTMIVLRHETSGLVIGLNQHRGAPRDSFDERRIGLDHVGFAVARREDLDAWRAHLVALGVEHSPVTDAETGSALVFRDPDHIQLELWWSRAPGSMPEDADAAGSAARTDGLIERSSPLGVAETVARLTEAARAAGVTVFATVDHAAGARSVGLEMPDTQVLLVGNPAIGTPAMQSAPDLSLDLPTRVLVRQAPSPQGGPGAPGSAVVFADPVAVGRRYGLTREQVAGLSAITGLVDRARACSGHIARMSTTPSVAVIGAGPAGLTASRRLRDGGVSVVMVAPEAASEYLPGTLAVATGDASAASYRTRVDLAGLEIIPGRAEAAAPRLAAVERGIVDVVISSVPYRCPPAPYGLAMRIARRARRRGLAVEVRLRTPEPHPLEVLGRTLGDVLLAACADAGVEVRLGTVVDPEALAAGTVTEDPVDHRRAALTFVIPPHRASPLVAGSVRGESPLVPVDERFATEMPGVFVVGDAQSPATPQADCFVDHGDGAYGRFRISYPDGPPPNGQPDIAVEPPARARARDFDDAFGRWRALRAEGAAR